MAARNLALVGSIVGLGIIGSYLMLSGTFDKAQPKAETGAARPTAPEAAQPTAVDPHAQVDPHGAFNPHTQVDPQAVQQAMDELRNEDPALAAAAEIAKAAEDDAVPVSGGAGRGSVKTDDGVAAEASLSRP